MSDSDRAALSERAAALWRAYLAGLPADHRHRTAHITEFSFGDSPAMADELAALVVSGRKQATATLAIQFAVDGAPLPNVGGVSVVTRADGTPVAAIETTDVRIVPFNAVDGAFAHAEGEGDRSLTWWRAAHAAYFGRMLAPLGRSFDETLLVVCERSGSSASPTERSPSATAERRRPVDRATPPAGCGTLIGLPVSRQSTVDTAELLRELRIDRDGRPTRNRRRLVVAVIALLIVMAAAWTAWSRFGVPTVRTVAARAAVPAGGPASVLDASGYVTARRQATVSAKVTGKVTEVLIEEGMRVAEGAVLARLDDTEAKAQLALARAQLAAARSQDGEIRAQLQQAERDYTRAQELFNRQLVPEQSMDAARAQRDTLRAKLAANQEAIRVATESVTVAQVQLDNTVIRAPFSGVVVAKSAQPGEMISPISAGGGFTRTGIGTIVDMDSLEFQVDVNESYINRVTDGQPVEATLNAYPDWKIPGSVIAIIPTADRSKATVKVRIAIKVKDARIVPDMGVRVAFLGAAAAPRRAPVAAGVLVPADAVRADGSVFVYADGRVARRSVTPGQTVGSEREIVKGLRAGERVVVAPPASLKDGAAVRVADK